MKKVAGEGAKRIPLLETVAWKYGRERAEGSWGIWPGACN